MFVTKAPVAQVRACCPSERLTLAMLFSAANHPLPNSPHVCAQDSYAPACTERQVCQSPEIEVTFLPVFLYFFCKERWCLMGLGCSF